MKRNSSRTNPKRSLGGFTLVELIVVIAILAILAGVGAVAYTGYIEYTKKGLDKQTVGEIMNAIELANYSDSSLIPDGSTATVYLTSNGVSAFSGSKTTEINDAIKDALGDLSAVKLNYSDWEGFDAATLSSLLTQIDTTSADSAIKQYIDAEGTASFSGDINEYWADVETLIDKFNAAYGGGDDESQGYLSKIVQYSANSANRDNIVSWFTGGSATLPSSSDVTVEAGVIVATNYAFASWVEKNYGGVLTEEQKEKVAQLKFDGASLNPASYLTLSGAPWDTYKTEYQSKEGDKKSQAEMDVLAFLGIMEAAKTMDPTGTLSDKAFVPEARKVVGSVSSVLDKSVSISELQKLVTTLVSGKETSIIAISASKNGGVLSFTVTPGEANPRNNSGTGNAVVEPTDCNEKTHHTALTAAYDQNTNVILKAGTIPVTSIELCGIKDELKTCTITGQTTRVISMSVTLVSGGECLSVSGSGTSWSLTATGHGTAKIKVTVGYWNGKGTRELEYTVNVH